MITGRLDFLSEDMPRMIQGRKLPFLPMGKLFATVLSCEPQSFPFLREEEQNSRGMRPRKGVPGEIREGSPVYQ